MYQVDTSFERWFGELTGFKQCNDCRGFIVDFDSTATSSDRHLSSSSSTREANSFPSTTYSDSGTRESLDAVAAQQSVKTPKSDSCGSLLTLYYAVQTPAKDLHKPKQQEGACELANKKSCPGMSRSLSTFYPGFIRDAPGPCSACRRVEGPHPTHCPGCTVAYYKRLRENPRPPPGYVGKKPPFGQAGWRVARGHRHPKPVTLHG